MDFKGLDERMWWMGMVLVGTAGWIGAIAAGRDEWALLALGVVIMGFGEWVQHPLLTRLHPPSAEFPGGGTSSGYPRRVTAFGLVLNLLGAALFAAGVYRVLR